MRTLFFTAALIGVAHPSLSQVSAPQQSIERSTEPRPTNPVGIWEGQGYQPNPAGPGLSYVIRLRINEGGNGIIQYPSLSCVGTLWRQSGTAGTEYREHIDVGKERCADNGRVVLQQRGDKLFFRWSGEGTRTPN